MPWIIAKFVETSEVEAIPFNWYDANDKMVAYPPFKKSQLEKAIKAEMKPEQNWEKYKVVLMRPHPIENFITACAKATKACLTSDISDGEMSLPSKRQHVRRQFSSDEESSEEDLPNIPPPSRKLGSSKTPKESIASSKSLSHVANPGSPKSSGKCDNSDTKIILSMVIKFKKILTDQDSKLQEINTKIEETNVLLRNLLENKNAKNYCPPIEDCDIFKDFPLNEGNFLVVEEKLKETAVFRKTVEDLAKLGGNNYKETSRRILKRVLDDTFFKAFSLHGHKGKQVFCETKIFSVIREAVHKNYEQYSLKDIEIVIGIWLTKCNERINKKGVSQDERSETNEVPADRDKTDGEAREN